MLEADLGTDPTPPINAKQGLLFEYDSSVFLSDFSISMADAQSTDGGAYFGYFFKQSRA